MTEKLDSNRFAPTAAEIQRMRRVAGGLEKADLILRGGQVVHVHTGRISRRDVVICGRHIAALTPCGLYEATEEYDAQGQYVVPNFIEAHFHVSYSMLTPGALAELIVPKGTTTVLADPNCIANVFGKEGVEYLHSTQTPLRMFLQISSSVPRTPGMELGGYTLTADDIGELLQQPYAVSLGEAIPFDLSDAAADVLAKALAAGKRVNGHSARLQGRPLWRYLAGGVCDDHNSATLPEIMEIMTLGGCIAVQSGSMSNYIQDVFSDPDALGIAASHIFFSADDKHVGDIAEEGHIDHHVRSAIACGVDPVLALRMASLNAAVHFRLDHLIGSVTPSRLADIMLLPDLKEIRPSAVFVNGQLAAKDGAPCFANRDQTPPGLYKTIHLGKFDGSSLRIMAPAGKDRVTVKVAELYDGYYKRLHLRSMPVINGQVLQDPAHDILKAAVLDRHHGTGKAGAVLIQGVGIRNGAIASANNCENQNIVVIGTSDAQMMLAIRTIEEMGGGCCVVENGQVTAKLPLPVAGTMSDAPWQDVYEGLLKLNAAAEAAGCRMHAPFTVMAFIGLAGVPDIGLSELGVIDVASQQFTDVIVEDNAENRGDGA